MPDDVFSTPLTLQVEYQPYSTDLMVGKQRSVIIMWTTLYFFIRRNSFPLESKNPKLTLAGKLVAPTTDTAELIAKSVKT